MWWHNWEVLKLRVGPFWRKPQRGVLLKGKTVSSCFLSLALLLAYCEGSSWTPSFFSFCPITFWNANAPADYRPKSQKPGSEFISPLLSCFLQRFCHTSGKLTNILLYVVDRKRDGLEFTPSNPVKGQAIQTCLSKAYGICGAGIQLPWVVNKDCSFSQRLIHFLDPLGLS